MDSFISFTVAGNLTTAHPSSDDAETEDWRIDSAGGTESVESQLTGVEVLVVQNVEKLHCLGAFNNL